MLDCGDRYNHCVEIAPEYLPIDVLDEYKESLFFVAMGQRDGCRIPSAACKAREIIVLAEHILPKVGMDEAQREFRYFIYVVLHEVAHAITGHLSPLYDRLTEQQVEQQEAEADDLALMWF